MTESARIVVGIDGSESSRGALRWALAEAALRTAVLEVLHAWREPMVFVPKAYDDALVAMGRMDEAALRFIERELDAVGADGASTAIERTQTQGSAAHGLIDASRRADLVVVGRHGLGGFPYEFVAPKVIQVAHHTTCPVAVIPDAWTGEGLGVVVGIDGSEHAATALRWALAEAARRKATTTAVMAWGLLDQHHVDPDAKYDPNYDAGQAKEALDAYVARATSAETAGAIGQIVMNDLPARALIEASAGAELLVVGARGMGGFRDLLLGSVSHRCLARAECPTVVVR